MRRWYLLVSLSSSLTFPAVSSSKVSFTSISAKSYFLSFRFSEALCWMRKKALVLLLMSLQLKTLSRFSDKTLDVRAVTISMVGDGVC